MEWKSELDAIVGARHGGQISSVLDLLKGLDARFPHVAEIQHQLAWTYESLGREAEALPHYENAVALGLPPNEASGALIGLSSSLRQAGKVERAVDVLRSAQRQFPANREIDAFLALALHQLGDHAGAVRLLLTTLIETSEDAGIAAYQRDLRYRANRLGESREK